MILPNHDDKNLLSAISALEHNEDFKIFRLWLSELLNTLRARNDVEQGIYLSWNQGGCQVVAAVIEVVDTARATIKAIEGVKARAPTNRGHEWA